MITKRVIRITIIGILLFWISNILVKQALADSYVIAQDTFNRLNQTYWGTASDGQKWTSDASSNNDFGILSNKGRVKNTNGSSYTGLIGCSVTDAEVLVSAHMESTYASSNWGATIRFKDTNNFYKAFIGSGINSGNGGPTNDGPYLILQKKVNSNYSVLDYTSFNAIPSTDYTIRFRIVGNNLYVKAWKTSGNEPGSWQLTATDSQFSSGSYGVRMDVNSSDVDYTSFTAFDLNNPPLKCDNLISGQVFFDTNQNGIKDPGENNYTGGKDLLTITNGSFSRQTNTDSTGYYYFSGLSNGTWCASLTTPPSGYTESSGTISPQCMLINKNSNPSETADFGIVTKVTPTPTPKMYNLSGVVYNDINKNGKYDSGTDKLYNGPNTITVSGGNLSQPQTFTVNKSGYNVLAQNIYLGAGTYSISYTIPSGYSIFYPGPPPSFSVTIGPSCNVPPQYANDASCDSYGNVINLNFGITNEVAWIQNVCGDWRQDSGITDTVPSTGSCGSGVSVVSNASALVTSAFCTNPGIFFSGNNNSSFTPGTVSSTNWLAGGSTYGEKYTPVSSGLIRTSYAYMMQTASQSGITPIDLTGVDATTGKYYCQNSGSINPCKLEKNLPDGVYIAQGDMTLQSGTNTYIFPSSKNFVILVNGNLTIKENILVPTGSSAIFSVGYPNNPSQKGNIYVDPSVGQSMSQMGTIQDANIQGLYSADNSFIVQSNTIPGSGTYCNSDGTSLDKKLNITGSVVVNAGYVNPMGIFQNSRDLCNQDTSCPAVSVSMGNGNVSGGLTSAGIGLTYLLNAPIFIKHQSSIWQDVSAEYVPLNSPTP